MNLRIATPADLPAMRTLMALAIDQLQSAFLSPAEIAASHAVMGLDSQLVADGTYFIVEEGAEIAGCGGWSRRATLYGGDHSLDLREPRLLDPASEPARIRAMYTHPAFARRGVGRMVLQQAEAAAREAGFARAELMATLSGAALYRACGYAELEQMSEVIGDVTVPLIRMGRAL